MVCRRVTDENLSPSETGKVIHSLSVTGSEADGATNDQEAFTPRPAT